MAKGLALVYLLAYNLACCLGWLYVLVICVRHVADNSIDTLWGDVEFTLKIVQTAAVLEVFNSLVGLVKSPWITALMQVFSRVWTLWAVMNVAPTAQNSIFTVLACTSWALVEVPRYLFYALNLLDIVPYPLLWLRYSLFAVLYPTGITGELGCMYQAGIYLLGSGSFAELPLSQQVLFGAIVFVALTYIPGSPKMYGHMVKTRKSQLGGGKDKKKGGDKDAKKAK